MRSSRTARRLAPLLSVLAVICASATPADAQSGGQSRAFAPSEGFVAALSSTPEVTLRTKPASLVLTETVTLEAVPVALPSGTVTYVFEYQEAEAETPEPGEPPWTVIESSGNAGFLNANNLANGLYNLRVRATVEGKHYEAELYDRLVANGAPPLVTLSELKAAERGTITLEAKVPNSGGGFEAAESVQFQWEPTDSRPGAGAWHSIGAPVPVPASKGAFSIVHAALDTTTLSDGDYNFRIVPAYASGEAWQTIPLRSVLIDNTPPQVAMIAPASPLKGPGESTLQAQAGDPPPAPGEPSSGVVTVIFQAREETATAAWVTIGTSTHTDGAAGAPSATETYDQRLFSESLQSGSYEFRAIAEDAVGNQTTSAPQRGIRVENEGLKPAVSASLSGVSAPAQEIHFLGTIAAGTPQAETWAYGFTSAPPADVDGRPLEYTAEGQQLVLLRYTPAGGWQIAEVLEERSGGSPAKAFPLLKPEEVRKEGGNQVRVSGAMTPSGEAWLSVAEPAASGAQRFGLFHRAAGAGQPFLLDTQATQALGPLLGSEADASVSIGETPTGQAYGILVSPGQPETLEQEPAGSGHSVDERLRYGLLENGEWTLQTASLPAALTETEKAVTLKLADLGAPGEGWGVFQRNDTEPAFRGQGLILGRLKGGSWSFAPTGNPALDLTGVDADEDGTVEARALKASGDSVWVEAVVALPPEQHEAVPVVALLGETPGPSSSVGVSRSWCHPAGDAAVQWSSCEEPLGDAVVPEAIFSSGGEVVALAVRSGFLHVFEHGRWTSVYAPGYGGVGAGSSDFAAPDEGWLAGANALGRWSSEASTSALASWPLPDRSTLTSVALPAGSDGAVSEAGALAVGFRGTALSYSPADGWQVNPVPARARNVNLLGVAFAGSQSAFAVGQLGTILHWNGSAWAEDPQSYVITGSQLNAVAFGSSGEGWAVGAAGTILHYDGHSWSVEKPPAEDAGVSLTSVAVAGDEAFAVAGGELITRQPGGSWEPASFKGGVAPPAERLRLVAGLPDGGVVVAGRSVLLFRQHPGEPFEYAPQPLQGVTVALAPFRDGGGELRTYVSIAPTADASTSFPTGDGELLRQTEVGWQDLSRAQYAGGGIEGDGAVKSDPVLAVATGSDGEHAWAVGGYDGTKDAAGQGTSEPLGTRPEGWQSASVWRYDVGSSATSPAQSSPIEPPVQGQSGTVSFAYFTSPLCRTRCSAVPDAQPDVNLSSAAREISEYAAREGGPSFAVLGGNAVGPIEANQFELGEAAAVDFEHLGEQLAPLGDLPTFAAAAPFDRVPRQPDGDELRPWAKAFAGAPAPFGSGPAASSITPVSSGPAEGEVHRYYAFDASEDGGTVRVIVLDDSAKGSFEPAQDAWLEQQLEGNANSSSPLPVVVVSGRPLRRTATADLEPVAELLAEPRWNGEVLAVFSTDGSSPRPFRPSEVHERDERRMVPEEHPEGPQIAEYEGATLGYQETANNGVTWYLASINTQARTVTVSAVPVLETLDLKAVDGLTAARSKTLQFEAIARRPAAGLATTTGEEPAFEGYDDYVQIPARPCSKGHVCIQPSYTFTSEDPAVGTFVEATGEGSPYPKLSKGIPIASATSGLFCAYSPGTTVVTITAGLLSYSETVTVEPGEVGSPCGAGPPPPRSTHRVTRTSESSAGAGAAPPAAPPTALAGVNPVITAVPPAPAPAAAPTPGPAPPEPIAEPLQTPAEQVPLAPAIVPATTPPVEPIPPGSGGYAQSPSAAERREKARKQASQSAFVIRPAGVSGEDWFYGALGVSTVLALLLSAGGIRGGSRGRPAPAFNRSPAERRRQR